MKAGFLVTAPEKADICIVNTCSVTAVADKKSRKAIQKLKIDNPNLLIVVTGCGARQAKDLPEVNMWIPNNDKERIFGLVLKELKLKNLDLIRNSKLEIRNSSTRTRALLKVQDGCNNFCAYCIVPHLRGREVSYPLEAVIKEAKKLRQMGYQELVLSGVNVGKYNNNGLDLTGLIKKILKETDFPRIRLSSINPQDVTDEMLKLWVGEPRLCRHFHLSLQSGSSSVLKRMGRPYTAEEYLNLSNKIVQLMPEAAITTDIIVGFPGETEEEFKETLDFVNKANLAKLHVFRYSKRAGTRAAVMPSQVPDFVKKERSTLLLRSSRVLEEEFKKRFLGEEMTVLFEKFIPVKTGSYTNMDSGSGSGMTKVWYGLTSNYIRVKYLTGENLENRFKRIKLTNENLA